MKSFGSEALTIIVLPDTRHGTVNVIRALFGFNGYRDESESYKLYLRNRESRAREIACYRVWLKKGSRTYNISS